MAVEYNQLNSFIKSFDKSKSEDDYTSGKRMSKFPGNINQFLVSLDSYSDNLDKCAGVVPEFINYKESDNIDSDFSTPARVETMMQDYIQKCSTKDKIVFTKFSSKTVFSPAKYSFLHGEKGTIVIRMHIVCCLVKKIYLNQG